MRPPSMAGWWKCCQCWMNVNPAVNSVDCPDFDCGHRRCHSCITYEGHDGTQTRGPQTAAMGSKNSDIRHRVEQFKGDHAAKAADPKGFKPVPGSEVPSSRLRANPKQLELYLGSKLVPNACADSGSTVNCMSLGLAQRLRIPFKHHIRIFNLPVKGAVIESIGLASITCHFPKEPSKPKYLEDKIEFFIFRSLARELIVGNPFLRGTGILDKFFWRLVDAETEQSGFVKINSVGNTEESVQCWLEGNPLQSLADTGAEINLISTEYARASGFSKRFSTSEDQKRSCIALGRTKRAGEGSKRPRPTRSEEYIFKDNLTNELDRYEKEIEEADNLFNLGSIGAVERQASKIRAEQAHFQWLRDHRELLERYFPGYYEKHVPQEVS